MAALIADYHERQKAAIEDAAEELALQQLREELGAASPQLIARSPAASRLGGAQVATVAKRCSITPSRWRGRAPAARRMVRSAEAKAAAEAVAETFDPA